jgi:hypothetical protein
MCVRHTRDGSKTACRGSASPGLDRLRFFTARFPKMNVHIYKPRSHYQPGAVQYLGVPRGQTGGDSCNPDTFDQDIENSIEIPGGIHHTPVA